MNSVASIDNGCITAIPHANDNVPSQLRALGTAIGKVSDEALPDVVAFTGLAGSGKSTASEYLVDRYGYTRVRFAGPLKAAMAALGFSQEEIDGSLKETPHELLGGKTPRHAMQTLGTEWGRNCIVDDFWIRLWRRQVDEVLASGGRVVVDDCRFQNEAVAIRKLGGDIFKIQGRGGIAGSHSSEKGIGQIVDDVLDNTGSVEELHQMVEEALRRFG